MTDSAKQETTLRSEQRKFFRFPVEGEAVLFLLEEGKRLRCRMLDLGFEGCRLRKEEEFVAPIGVPVEIAFRIAGTPFRAAGVLAWVTKKGIFGVQFQRMSEHRKEDLAELLAGMREELEARAKEREAAKRFAEEQATRDKGKPPGPQLAETPKRERRGHDRQTVDAYARLNLLSLHQRVVGTILDVSMGGCRIRTEERFTLGAFRRVEIEFMVGGLPLLLPGVTQTVHDRNTLGIRFVEMTDRKRGQLKTVIDEISERNMAAAGDAGEEAPPAAEDDQPMPDEAAS